MSKQILFRAQARKKEGRLELNKKHVPIDWVYGSVVHQNSNKKMEAMTESSITSVKKNRKLMTCFMVVHGY